MKCPKCQADNPETKPFCGDCGTQLFASKTIPSRTETFETPTEALTRGETFAGRYEIIEELGTGGMGKVYRVEDKKVKAEIALKLIRPDISADKKTIERFSNELKMTRMISHRHVCRMFDLGEHRGTCFITMEYVRGEDLKSLLRMSKRLEFGAAISIAKQVCEGLAEAHRLGIVHRDLKPSNILIDKEGNARIMDFGIARSIQAKGMTAPGMIIGTPEYMSPEQADAKDVDARSDIYSLGVILYEMVTGRVPFEGDTQLSVVVKHKSEQPKDPRDFNPQIPENLSRLILKCLKKKPEGRYDSVQALGHELDIVQDGILQSGKKAPAVTGTSSHEDDQGFSQRSSGFDHVVVEKDLEKIIAYSQLSIKDDIVHVTFNRTDRIVSAINDITKNIPWDPDQVVFVNQGGGEITLILDREKKGLFQDILPQAAEIREDAAVITIRERSTEDIAPGIEVPGLFAFFLNQMSLIQINILDIISTRSTLTLVVAAEDLTRAYLALSDCVQGARKRVGKKSSQPRA